jgi:predicted DsbA family dithiol-disulfide isomerase
MRIQISVTSDFICPWCYIGAKRLARAIENLPTGIEVQLQWLPFELNPDMPAEGMDRRTYLSRKFGSWERVQGATGPDRARRTGRRSHLRL